MSIWQRHRSLHLEANCQHRGCRQVWRARMYQNGHPVSLCISCADFLLVLRQRDKDGKIADEWVATTCHQEEVLRFKEKS